MNKEFDLQKTIKQTLYLLAISVVMLVGLLLKPEDIPRDTNEIVSYLTSIAAIPNSVTAVILGSRLFDTIGEVVVFSVAGLGVKILLSNQKSETTLIGIQDPIIIFFNGLCRTIEWFSSSGVSYKRSYLTRWWLRSWSGWSYICYVADGDGTSSGNRKLLFKRKRSCSRKISRCCIYFNSIYEFRFFDISIINLFMVTAKYIYSSTKHNSWLESHYWCMVNNQIIHQ